MKERIKLSDLKNINLNINTNTTIRERVDKRGRVDPPKICPVLNDENICLLYSEKKRKKISTLPSNVGQIALERPPSGWLRQKLATV